MPRLTRRALIAAGASTLAMPAVLRAEPPPPVKLGLIHPATGSLAFSGTQCRKGAQYAVADINLAGGIKSMGGARINPIYGDAQGRAEIAAGLVDRMAKAGAVGLTGCFSSTLGLAATQAAATYNLPFSIDGGSADNLTTRGLGNVFRLFPNNSGAIGDGVATLDAINKAAGSPARTVIIVNDDGDFGTEAARLLNDKLPGIGLAVLATISHPTPMRDFTGIVLRIKAANPDIVMISNYQNEYVLLARTLVQQRVQLLALYSMLGGGFNLKFASEAPTIAQDMMDFNQWYNPRNPAALAFRKRVEDAGATFTWELLLGYFAVRFLADGWERAGGTDREKTNAALAASTFSDHFLPYGPTRMIDGQNQGAHCVALQMQHGDIKVVGPAQYADAKAVYPRPKA
jgi:branched-chain amino acid transport system substrate-binding protein